MFHHKKADGTHLSHGSSEAEKPFGTSTYGPASQSGSAYDRGKTTNHSIVDECLTMKGDLESDGDILIKGKVMGNIRCKLLIIDVDALVEGGIDAEDVIIRGNAKGTIQANRVKLEKTAKVDSEICHLTFAAEEGARIKGALRFRDEPLEEETRGIAAKAA